ncbi:MarR family winged helix-turn-helix transcriptional regulator [Actinoplanes sp. GCM10030250]|uniref:MarR family winged helix-turn-helix transcriptional regulator n=1 Tax=Actinoplanes sp. GCM10030250 TaxID=3273376 RepID=UPI003618D624
MTAPHDGLEPNRAELNRAEINRAELNRAELNRAEGRQQPPGSGPHPDGQTHEEPRRPSETSAEKRPEQRLVFGLMNAERWIRRWIDARAGDSGIGAAGAGVLFHLALNDNALVGDVTAALCASPSGMSGLITRLEKGGFVAKSPDPVDARAVRLTLTSLGREAVGSARTVVRDLNAHLTAGFTPDELRTVGRWLEQAATIEIKA